MHRTRTSAASLERLEHAVLRFVYPALDRVPANQRNRVLRAARATELDTSERVGVVSAVGVTAYLLQSTSDASEGLLAVSLGQFLLAWPLLAVLVAPWLVRRTRRGLQHETQRFDGGDSCPESQTPMSRTGTRSSPTVRERTAEPTRNS
jgi:hypothetical protein